ncbi:MAG: hypothetical protein GTO40_23535 [Deltaproteobacteria bacterium]|nr:hypothetical protein [Deltaproteobacteria bacterium]
MFHRIRILLIALVLLLPACNHPQQNAGPRMTMFVGIDISGSYRRSAHFNDSLRFLSYYIYGHMHGIGGMEKIKNLFVGSIGGDTPNEPKAFHPIQEFQGKSARQIEAKMRGLFSIQGNYLTDFNSFFKRVSEVVQKRSLAMAPLTIIIISDGVPDMPMDGGRRIVEGLYEKVNVSPLEFLARNVTIRILYPSPTVAQKWEREIPRQRVRIWPVVSDVMKGWKEQMKNHGTKLEDQELFWKWVEDIVDHRVRRQKIF